MNTEVKTISTAKVAKRKREAHIKEYIEAVLIAVVIAVILRMFVVQAYNVTSGSMENSLMEGDYLFVNKFVFHFSEPQVGDIIVFEYPLNPSKDFIKRIIASPGQKVEIREKKLFLDDKPAIEYDGVKNIDNEIISDLFSPRDNFGPFIVPSGQYFVLGDNRDDSQDSRFWGFLEKKHIKGKAMFVYWSWAPDRNAPRIEPPYITDAFAWFFYNLVNFPTRIRWERLFSSV